ncbi:MAG: ubiquinone biosynthesis protein UbiA [Deltaproteobacteria bacterium SG8_13]|nr:MAG: ubiquinone biosynthesis protein UbiA [Deltaproteobacteria bacterium SG8_13]
MDPIKNLLGPMRVSFLILTPACVALGLGSAFRSAGSIDPVHAALVLIGAISAHISVNAFNEYFDCKSGLDFRTQRTPFSGGSGTLPAQPHLAGQALGTAVVSFGIATAIGIYFSIASGPALIPVGVLGLFLLIFYTPWIAHNAFLCLIAPGLGFGPCMVMGTEVALTGRYTGTALVASLVPFFLVSNLLLLNQFPDVEADRSIGRQHYPILIGRRASSRLYFGFLVLTYLSILCGVLTQLLPKWSLIGLFTVLLAVPASITIHRYPDNIQKLLPAMGMNVVINIATPVLLAVGLFL